jgi:glycosyltransferase involved in cell wall biosynthesis
VGRVVRVAVVVPVYRNEDTLEPLVARLGAALAGHDWSVRLVVDASPDGSAAVAQRLAGRRVTAQVLPRNVGQHRALALGLAAADGADAWVCLDADLQDPPEAVPLLLARLGDDAAAVFAGRRGAYESPLRLRTGRLHRALMARLTGLPPDAGAFLALDARARAAVLREQAPSLVAALGASRLPLTSIPVQRAPREVGASAWTTRARLRQSAATLAWTLRHRTR